MNNSVPKIHTCFKNYQKKLRHIWEEYSFMEFYDSHIHRAIKNDEFPVMQFNPFLADATDIRTTSKVKSIGVLGQVKKNSIMHRVLLDSIGAFENYLCFLAETVYSDYPSKLKSKGSNENERDEKLINMVIDSINREEIISKIIEEKIRSIFYGNPVDFFEKDKARLEFGDYFKNEIPNLLKEYSEIIARRNLIIHNAGRVDRKYLREIKNSGFKLGNKIDLTFEYLKRMMCVLEWLASAASVKTIENIYKASPRGGVADSFKSLNLKYGNNAV